MTSDYIVLFLAVCRLSQQFTAIGAGTDKTLRSRTKEDGLSLVYPFQA